MSDFKPSKLSRASLDAFVKKHGSKTPKNTQHVCTPFKIETGETYYVDTTQLLLNQQTSEFKYLLSQTIPAYDRTSLPSLKALAYI